MKYHIWTEGCQMNVADSQRVASALERLGFDYSHSADEADVIVLNTCVVRQSAEAGTYLTIVDPNYLGIGKFDNFWAIMMLVKHIVIVGMIGIGFWFNAILRVGPMMSSNHGAEQAIARFRNYVNCMAVSGVLVLLLTALAQVK